MLTHSGHGSVTALKPNITQTKDVSPQCARVMIRRITGSAALGKDQLDVGAAYPQCDHPVGSPESLERHSVRCPNGGQRHYICMRDLCRSLSLSLLMACWCPQELHCPGEEGPQGSARMNCPRTTRVASRVHSNLSPYCQQTLSSFLWCRPLTWIACISD